MPRAVRAHLTFSNVVSVLALFVALGLGTAWALERNSVRSKHIVTGQVKGIDIQDDGVTGDDIDEPTLSGVLKGTVVRREEVAYANLNAGNNVGGTVGCGSGEVAVGGGGDFEPSAGGDSILNSYPSPGTEGAEPTGWTMNMNRGATGAVTEIRFAICAPK